MPSPRRSIRALVLFLATVLAVPLTALMGVAPAHAAPGAASGAVYDGLGDPLTGVAVKALAAPAFTTSVAETVTAAGGSYSLPLAEGSYRLQFSKAGFATALYGTDDPIQVDVDDEGQLSVDGEPLEDNELDDVSLVSTQTYTVTGVVQNAGSTPLAGIQVEAFHPGDEENAVSSATSNGSGAYALTLPAGVYHVRYTDPGDTYLTTWYDGTGEPVDVIVTANRSLTTVKLATPPPGAEYPIAGTVVDANGDPVDGVSVSVDPIGASTDSGTGTTAPEGDDGGRYSVSVRPGTYRVSFARSGWVSTKVGGQATPATVTVGATGAVSVSGSDPLTSNRLADVVLVSNPFAVTGLVQVTGGTTPIADITVRAFPTGSTDPGDVVDTDAATDANGSYTLNLPVGTYDLEFVDNVATPTTYSSASLTEVQVGQGGALKVGGVAVDALDPVKLSLSSADTTHPVLGSLTDVNGAEIDGLEVSAVPQGGGTGDVEQSGADGDAGAHGRYRLLLKPGSYEIHVAGGADWSNATYTAGGEGTALVQVALNGTISVNGTPIAGRDLGETEVPGKTKYTLSGTVTDGAAGLPGITVKAYAEGNLTTAVATTTSTGTSGAWSFTGVDGLVVGSYVIELSGTSGGNTYDTTYVGGATATPVEIAQGGGAKLGGVPVGANTLPAVTLAKSSADTPHPVTGEVTDANEDPLDGVTVTATPQGTGTLATATSGADGELGDHGRYRLSLKPGTYRVSYARTGFTGTTYGGDLSPVDVKVNLNGTVLIGSAPAPEAELAAVELADATADGIVSGRVVSGANGVGGITVEVFPVGDVSGTPIATATTASSGTIGAWSVSTLKIGTYTVRFTDNVPAAPAYIQTYVGGNELASAAPVKVGQGNAVTVATVPAPGGDIGTTEMAAESASTTYPVVGELLDEAGDPIDGATVTAVPQSPTPGANQATDQTGADGELGDHGRYRLLLKPGTYQLSFAATGFTTATYPGAGETVVPVTVASGGIITPATLDSMTLADTTGDDSITGKVVAGGSGVAGIVAEVFPAGDLAAESRVGFSTATTTSGTWTVTGLKIGEYTVRFTDNGAAAPAYVQTYYGGTTLAESTPVKVGQGHAVSVNDVPKTGGNLGDTPVTEATATTTYPLSGDVSDANGEPLDQVTVSVEVLAGGGAADPVTTDEEGGYVLQAKAGTYRVLFARSGFATEFLRDGEGAIAQVKVTLGGAVTIGEEAVPGGVLDTFEMRSAPRSLKGRVLGAGSPLGGITVKATRDGSETAITATSASNGTFTLALPVGTYQVEYVGRVIGSTTWDGRFFGDEDGTPDLVKVATPGTISVVDGAVLPPPATLPDVTLAKSSGRYDVRGTVSDETGEPLAGATVRAFKAGTSTLVKSSLPSAADGTFSINVPVGKYHLRYEKTGKATTWLLNADADTPTYAVVTVAPGGVISAPGVAVTGGVLEDVQLLLPAPRMVAAPKASGKVLVGKTITTTLGTWSPDFRSTAGWQDYVTIEWFIDGKPADDYSDGDLFEKFAIPAVAGGRTVSYRITVEDPNPEGATRAPIVFTSKGIKVPKAKPKLVATYKGGKLTVVVKVAGLKRPLGSIVVKDGRKKLGAGTLKATSKGKVVIKLKKPKKGKRKLTITYSGDANVAPTKVKVKIKI